MKTDFVNFSYHNVNKVNQLQMVHLSSEHFKEINRRLNIIMIR